MKPWSLIALVLVLAPAFLRALRLVPLNLQPVQGPYIMTSPLAEREDHLLVTGLFPPEALYVEKEPPPRERVRAGRRAFAGLPLELVAEYLPLRVYLVAAFSVETGVSVWEVAFSPGMLMGKPFARPLSRVALSEFGCKPHLRLEHISFLPSRDTVTISCTYPPEEHTIFWDPYRRSEILQRLPVGEILAASPRGDMLVVADVQQEKPATVWHVERGTNMVLVPNKPALAGAFSDDGNKLAILVESDDSASVCCRLEVWSTVSGQMLCAAHSPFGNLAFHGDRIAIQGVRHSFDIRDESAQNSEEVCRLVTDDSDERHPAAAFSDMHLPSGLTLHANTTAVLVSRGDEVLHSLELRYNQIRGFISPDGRMALLSIVDISGNFAMLLWPFADGRQAWVIHDRCHNPTFSPDGAVLATIASGRRGANLTHMYGGGDLYLSAGRDDMFHGVDIGHPKPIGFAF